MLSIPRGLYRSLVKTKWHVSRVSVSSSIIISPRLKSDSNQIRHALIKQPPPPTPRGSPGSSSGPSNDSGGSGSSGSGSGRDSDNSPNYSRSSQNGNNIFAQLFGWNSGNPDGGGGQRQQQDDRINHPDPPGSWSHDLD